MKNRLSGQTVYLIGAIDRAPDIGAGWRDRLSHKLKQFNLNIYNPLEKPCDQGNEMAFRAERQNLKDAKNYDKLTEYVKEIRHIDLRMVDFSDFLICYIDMDIFMCGSFEEVTIANLQHKPVIVWCKQGKASVPDWLFGQLKHQLFFSSIDEVIDYLYYVDTSVDFDSLDRWIFFNR